MAGTRLRQGFAGLQYQSAEALAKAGKPGHDEVLRPFSLPYPPGSMTSRTATLIGLTAILMWSLLAALTVATGKIPAFQLAAMTFAIGGLVGLLTFIGRPGAIRALRQRPAAWAPLGSISKIAVAAIVLSEDWAFYQHNGFDWEQIQGALEKNWKTGRFARGGSTITQQVVKNVFLSNEKTLSRKLQEAVLTVRIERSLSKQRILEACESTMSRLVTPG